MKLKVTKESASGLNTEFVNVETGRVNKSDETTYIRSKADGIKKNNIKE